MTKCATQSYNEAKADRDFNRNQWADILTDTTWLRCLLDHILLGNYGEQECFKAHRVLASSRSNQAAYFGQAIARLNCSLSDRDARKVWNSQPVAIRKAANKALVDGIKAHQEDDYCECAKVPKQEESYNRHMKLRAF